MEIKFQMLTIMFIVTMTSSTRDDDDKNDNIVVPDIVSKTLRDKYPTATDVKWERKGSYFVVDCWMNDSEMDVWYDTQATWKPTEVDTFWEGLPAAMQTAFKGRECTTRKLEDIDMLKCPEQPMQYVIEVENGNQEYQLFYGRGGNILDKRDVSDDKGDTRWPVNKL